MFLPYKKEEMQCLLIISISLMSWRVVIAEDEDCRPLPPFLKGERKVHPTVCCNLESAMPDIIDANLRLCLTMIMMSHNQTTHEALMGSDYKQNNLTMPKISRSKGACLGECIFNESGLLTTDKQVDKEAVYRVFSGSVASSKDIAPVMTAALDKCFNVYEEMINKAQECTSGSEELRKCIFREMFLNCPAANWNSGAECMELKNKYSKCPNLEVFGTQIPLTLTT